jgi:predicted nucleic acid-binding protein
MSEHADRFTVVLDTNVLVGALSRNMLLSLAEDGLFRARWSQNTLHQEFERTFIKLYGDGDIAARQRGNIEMAFPEGLVIEDPGLMSSLTLPDPDDRHVLAAAIQTKAALIVTQNLKDLPAENLAPHEIEAISTDDFLADCIDLAGLQAVAAFRRMRERFRNPQIDAEALILRIEQLGLGQTANMLGEFRSVL